MKPLRLALAASQRVRAVTRSRGSRIGLILVYHRVADLSLDPQQLAVHPALLREHLAVLRAHTRVVSLQTLVADTFTRTARDPLPVALTFDDGYTDNLSDAYPILEECGAPATVFVTSGFIDGKTEPPWETLNRVLLRSSMLSPTLELRVGRRTHRWSLHQHVDPRPGDGMLAPTAEARYRLHREVASVLIGLTPAQRTCALRQLAEWSDSAPAWDPGVFLSQPELRELAASELIDIGAHTVNHPVLAGLEYSDQVHELLDSKAELERIIGYPIRAASYPYGSWAQYSRTTVQIARHLYSYACANTPGTVTSRSDKHELPRILVRNWTGQQFSEKILHRLL